MTKNKSKHKNIMRIDQPTKRTYGWYARICFKGKYHNKFFADKKNGGKDSALLAAVTWRDETRARIGKPQTDRNVVSVSKNPTGIVGVRLNEKLFRYEISWIKPDGRQSKTSVSIAKHGKKEALRRAVQKREEKEKERLERNLTKDNQ